MIVIEPANPQVVYVPQYNPQVVYTQAPTSTTVVVQEDDDTAEAVAAGLIGFTAGIAIGAAMNNDYYYGPYGWHGGGYMYNDAWDDYYDDREDAREDWQDHREDLAEERGDRAEDGARTADRAPGERRSRQRTERQQTRQENRPKTQAQRDARAAARPGARRRRRRPRAGEREPRSARTRATATEARRRRRAERHADRTRSPATRAASRNARPARAASAAAAARAEAAAEAAPMMRAMRRHRRLVLALACALLALSRRGRRADAQPHVRAPSPRPKTPCRRSSPPSRPGTLDELIAIFGPDGQDLVDSSDAGDRAAGTARCSRSPPPKAGGSTTTAPTARRCVVGNEDWPFPVPLVQERRRLAVRHGAAGKEEVLARRIGRNELAAIDTCRTYVAAQQRYAQQGHDGKPAGLYAQAVRAASRASRTASTGRRRTGEKRSPLGDLVAQAAAEGRPIGGDPAGSRRRSTATTSRS